MIYRDLIMTVNNTTATLNEPLQIYQHDRGITLRIKVVRYKYNLQGKLTEENVAEESAIKSARAVIQKPNDGDRFECPRQEVEDNYVIIPITLDWTDDLIEIGKYRLQIQLYGADYITERVTLPPVEFTVAPVIFVPEEGVALPAYAESAYLDNDYLSDIIGDEDDGVLPNGIYDRTYWKAGDVLTAEELNKSEKAIEYLVRTQKAKAVYLPEVSDDGVISWTNNLDYDNPEPVNIMGPQGPQGEQGIQGEKGDRGDDGTSIKILGTEPTKETLDARHLATAQLGDSYVVTEDGDVYVFSGEEFVNVGPMQGPKGDKGDKGDKLRYNDLTAAEKADLQKGFVASESLVRIEIVTQYPANPEDNVLYIRVEE